MAEIKAITQRELQDISGKTGFAILPLIKDYYITLTLYLLKDVEGLYFKGGTALQKIFLKQSRLSEDIDYTLTEEMDIVKKKIEETVMQSGFFEKVSKDKHISDFLRLIVHYTDPFGNQGEVFIDLNKKAKLVLAPEVYGVPHFYTDNIPEFSVRTLHIKELVAEKIRAAVARNKPRDHFDVYQIISNNLPVDLNLVKEKCKSAGHEFDIIRMFHNANKLKNRWDTDVAPLLREEVKFLEVMKTLASYFKYAEEKKMKRQNKPEKLLREESGQLSLRRED